jgi:hypothetical protein
MKRKTLVKLLLILTLTVVNMILPTIRSAKAQQVCPSSPCGFLGEVIYYNCSFVGQSCQGFVICRCAVPPIRTYTVDCSNPTVPAPCP